MITRITESRVRRIVKEEAEQLLEMSMPGRRNPRSTFEEIKKIIDEALINKSFGFSRRVTEQYIEAISAAIDSLDSGGQEPAQPFVPGDESSDLSPARRLRTSSTLDRFTK